MTEAQFYQRLLDLDRLAVTCVEHHADHILIHATIEAQATPCPLCLKPTTTVNQYTQRRLQDLSISGKAVWLELRVPQYACHHCTRYFTDEPDWILPGKSHTRRQAKWIFELCAKQPFSEVAALVGRSHKTVERLYYAFAREQINLPERYAQVRRLGIDEIAHRKGKRDYVCVLTDLDRGVQLDVLPDRKKATLMAHFEALGRDFADQIEVVCCDMWRPYAEVARACFPTAKLVVDRFHVMKALNGVLDAIRKQLRREHKGEASFKQIKWLLFKRRPNESERVRLEAAFSKSWLLEEVWSLRQTFGALLDQMRSEVGLARELGHWMAHAEALGSAALSEFVGTLRRWQEAVVGFAETRVTNAVTEGLNNYVRYFKRISFGLPSFEHMRLRILMATA